MWAGPDVRSDVLVDSETKTTRGRKKKKTKGWKHTNESHIPHSRNSLTLADVGELTSATLPKPKKVERGTCHDKSY